MATCFFRLLYACFKGTLSFHHEQQVVRTNVYLSCSLALRSSVDVINHYGLFIKEMRATHHIVFESYPGCIAKQPGLAL